jgi:hypothetical protein
MKRFRRAKVRAKLLTDECFFNLNLRVIKFIEISDEGIESIQLTINKSANEIHTEQDVQGEKERKKASRDKVTFEPQTSLPIKQEDEIEVQSVPSRHDNHDEKSDDNNNSSSMADQAFLEEIRQLKDIKAVLSEKTVAKSIKILSRTISILFTLLIVITCN